MEERIASTKVVRVSAAALVLAFAATAHAQGFLSPGVDDLGAGTFGSPARQGWLYEHGGVGSNCLPPAHATAVHAAADAIAPIDGQVVLLSVGASVTEQIFASFERQVEGGDIGGFPIAQPHPQLVLVNGGQGGESANIPVSSSAYWQRVDSRLAALGLTPDQVQILWLSKGYKCEQEQAGWDCADALQAELRATLQFLKAEKFPNLALCYLSSRIYAGYVATGAGEPYAYMEGWSVRGVIREQTECAPGAGLCLGVDDVPAALWGPYLWASGPVPRIGQAGCPSSAVGAGLRWLETDFESDSFHPSAAGETKAAQRMYAFFRSDAHVGQWFAPDCTVGRVVTVEASADTYVDQGEPQANFGAADALAWELSPDNERVVFVKFDLSGLGLAASDVGYAKLSLRNPEWVSSSENQFLDVTMTETADDWDEGQVDWQDQPEAIGAPFGWLAGGSRDGTRVGEVTDLVRAALDPGQDGQFSLALRLSGPGDTLSKSRETGDGPRLVLSVTAPELTESYCTAGTSAAGCRATLSAVGTARPCGPAPFLVQAGSVEGTRSGLIFLGTNGRKAASWGSCSSYRCIAPPVQRTAQQPAGGSAGACDGVMTLDFNAWACAKPGAAPAPGFLVQAQAWYRDPSSTCNQTTALSDALEFLVCP